MKTITREWLSRAAEDLAAAQALLLRADLTNVVAFHAQQTVEKTLKAVIEEYDLGMIRTHSLTRLYELVRPHHPVIADMDMLDRLESVYVEARYPGDLGLLPTGRPTLEETTEFYNFARDVFERLSANLEDTEADTNPEPTREE